MNKVTVLALSVAFVFSFITLSFAAPKPKIVTQLTTATVAMSQAQTEALAKAAVEKLNSQSWAIRLILQHSPRAAVESDLLTFTGTSMSSANLSAKGYSSSNFTPIVREDNSVILETVQRLGEDNVAMWRVELIGDNIQGVLAMRASTGPVSLYNFTSSMPSVPVSRVQPVQTQSTQTQSTQTQSTQTQKK